MADRLVFAQCGNQIQELNDALEARGLPLPTSGASDGQTLAGAISTGTHGSAHQVGAMQDYVVGIHLVGERGEPYWIERQSRPVVSERFLGFVDTPAVNLLRSDELFNAVLVSFGSFGVIHGLMFQVEPLYSLESHLRRFDVPAVRHAIETLEVGSLGLPEGDQLPFHFEVVLNPHRTGAGERGAYVRFMYKPSFALLAFTRFAPTCTVEIQAVDSARSAEAYARIWAALEAEGIPFTLHWGQALPARPAHYARVYGESLRRWQAAREGFLTPDGRRLFSSPLLHAVGLE